MPSEKNLRVLVTAKGGPEVLKLVEENVPEPQAGQVRVRVLAPGVAFADILIRAACTRAIRRFRSRPAMTLSVKSMPWFRPCLAFLDHRSADRTPQMSRGRSGWLRRPAWTGSRHAGGHLGSREVSEGVP
jgi:hypothetical protein